MRTTIALDASLRDRLLERKRSWRAASLEAVLEQLLAGPPATAEQLYRLRKTAVEAVCRKYRLGALTAFGSRARGDARPDSDLDLHVTYPRGTGVADVLAIEEELGQAFGLPVHLAFGKPEGGMKRALERDGVLLRA